MVFFLKQNFVNMNATYLKYFFVFVEITFFDFFSSKFMFFPLILILREEKVIFLIIIWVSKEQSHIL